MHPARLAVRRATAQAPLLAAIAALVLVVAALLAGIPRFLDSASTSSARSALQSADPQDAAARVQVRLAADGTAQAQAMDAVLAPLLSGADAVVLRSVQSDAVTAVLPDGQQVGIRLLADPTSGERIDVLDGEWPATGIALQATAAEELGLGVGDEVAIGDSTLQVAALWLPIDPSQREWFGDDAVASGHEADAWGPALISEEVLADLGVNPFAVWTMLPDLDELDAARIPALRAAASNWESAVRADSGLSRGGVVASGGLADSVETIERGIASVRGVSPIPLAVVGVIGAIALLQLARLLTGMRAAESLLMRARGRSTIEAGVSAGIESLVVAAPAAGAGALLGVLLVPGTTGPWPWLTAAAVALGAALMLGAASARASKAAQRPVRATLGGYIGALVLAAVGSGVSLWQFRLYGSPVLETDDGDVIIDPLAVLSTPLSLLTLALAAVAVLPLVFGAAEAAAARRRFLAAPLVARQLSRRPAEFAVPVMLTTLAVSATVFASAYSATWGELTQRAGELRNGADLRVELATAGTVGGAASLTSSAPFAVDGARATPVLVADTESGDSAVELVAISAAELDIVSTLGGSFDRGSVADDLGGAPAGIMLEATATEVAAAVSVVVTPLVPGAIIAPGQGSTALTAWVSDAQGALARLALEADASGRMHAGLPDGVAPWSVVAVDAAVTVGATPATYAVQIAVDGASTEANWMVQPDAGAPAEATGALGFTVTSERAGPPLVVRMMPERADALPVAITSSFADRLGLEPGSDIRLRFAGSGLAIEGVVAGTLAQIPGSTAPLGALVDLRALNDTILRSTSIVPRPGEIWIASTTPRETASALATRLPAGARVTTVESGSGLELQRPVVAALWIGAVGSLLLAAAAVAAVSSALLRSRRSETVALKAIGVRNAAQGRGRAWELGLVVALGVVAGAAAGYAVCALTVADLARSAVLDAPRTIPAPVVLDLPLLGVVLAGFGIAIAVLLVVTGVRVSSQASRSTGREVEA